MVALGEFEDEAFFVFAEELDVLDVDHIAAVAAEEAFVVVGGVELLHGVVEDEGVLFVAVHVVDVAIIVGGGDVENVGAAGGEGEFAAAVVEIDVVGFGGDESCSGFDEVAKFVDLESFVVECEEEDGDDVGDDEDGEHVECDMPEHVGEGEIVLVADEEDDDGEEDSHDDEFGEDPDDEVEEFHGYAALDEEEDDAADGEDAEA